MESNEPTTGPALEKLSLQSNADSNDSTTTTSGTCSANEPAQLPPAPSFKAVLLQFLKQLATTSTDLHRITAPAIMLNGVSLLEYMTHWCDHPHLLADIPKGETRKGNQTARLLPTAN